MTLWQGAEFSNPGGTADPGARAARERAPLSDCSTGSRVTCGSAHSSRPEGGVCAAQRQPAATGLARQVHRDGAYHRNWRMDRPGGDAAFPLSLSGVTLARP